MAAREVVEVISSDEEFKEPPRKPIGWNYQRGGVKDGKTKSRANGAAAATAFAASASHCSKEDSDDDLEVIEVKVEPKNKEASLPPSSSRAEIRRQIRNTTQSSVLDFFSKSEDERKKESKGKDEKKGEQTTVKASGKDISQKEEDRLKKEEGVEDYEEQDDKSPATLEAFLSRWEEIKPLGKDDQKIRDKLWKHYHLAHTSYTHSKKFIKMVESSIPRLTVDNIYVLIKDILDCLKRYKDTPYKEKLSGEESAGTSREGTPALIEVEDSKTNKKLRKIDKMMKEIAQKIKDLENQEVDLDDEVNSTYLVEERLKRQFTKLHSYYCRLANCSSATGRPIEKKFKFRGSRYQEINKRVTAWVNKHKEFPDYTDILNLVKKVTKQSSIPLRPETVRVLAQEIFRDVGKMLKDRRESDDLYSIYSYVDEEGEDPAKEDNELNNKLSENEKVAEEKLNKIFQEFVEKDARLREEADTDAENKMTKSPAKQDSESQDPSKASDSKEGENSKVDCTAKDEVSATTVETQKVIESDIDTCRQKEEAASIENQEKGEEEEEESSGDMAEDTGSDEDISDEDDNSEEEEEEEEEEESEPSPEQTSSGAKIEGDLDEGDETDDELKDVLASACRDEEEEEDSEEDLPVLDSEELLGLDELGTVHEESNSIVGMDDENKENEPSTAIPEEIRDDDPSAIMHEETATTLPSALLQDSENGSSVPTSNTSPTPAAATAHASPTSTTIADMTTSHQKRQLEVGGSPACKKLCVESPKS